VETETITWLIEQFFEIWLELDVKNDGGIRKKKGFWFLWWS